MTWKKMAVIKWLLKFITKDLILFIFYIYFNFSVLLDTSGSDDAIKNLKDVE